MQMLVKDSVMLFYDLKRLLTSCALRCELETEPNQRGLRNRRYKLVSLCGVIRISRGKNVRECVMCVCVCVNASRNIFGQ